MILFQHSVCKCDNKTYSQNAGAHESVYIYVGIRVHDHLALV